MMRSVDRVVISAHESADGECRYWVRIVADGVDRVAASCEVPASELREALRSLERERRAALRPRPVLESAPARARSSLAGTRIGRLRVHEPIPDTGTGGRRQYTCTCECGAPVVATAQRLYEARSCGYESACKACVARDRSKRASVLRRGRGAAK